MKRHYKNYSARHHTPASYSRNTQPEVKSPTFPSLQTHSTKSNPNLSRFCNTLPQVESPSVTHLQTNYKKWIPHLLRICRHPKTCQPLIFHLFATTDYNTYPIWPVFANHLHQSEHPFVHHLQINSQFRKPICLILFIYILLIQYIH